MDIFTKSIATILKYVTIAILIHSTNAWATSIENQSNALQEIIDSADNNEQAKQRLEKHSAMGRLLSEYILVFEKIGADGVYPLADDMPVDVIPNYLALRFFSDLKMGGNSQESKAVFRRLMEAHKKYDLIDETGPFFNLVEFRTKIKSSSDPVSESLRIKNLRYISRYGRNWSDVYFNKLKTAKGWVVNREVAYWKTKVVFQSCESAKRINGCILELAQKAPKKSLDNLIGVEKVFCEVKLISAGEIIEVSVCNWKNN